MEEWRGKLQPFTNFWNLLLLWLLRAPTPSQVPRPTCWWKSGGDPVYPTPQLAAAGLHGHPRQCGLLWKWFFSSELLSWLYNAQRPHGTNFCSHYLFLTHEIIHVCLNEYLNPKKTKGAYEFTWLKHIRKGADRWRQLGCHTCEWQHYKHYFA
jgi:hypothetical protein